MTLSLVRVSVQPLGEATQISLLLGPISSRCDEMHKKLLRLPNAVAMIIYYKRHATVQLTLRWRFRHNTQQHHGN